VIPGQNIYKFLQPRFFQPKIIIQKTMRKIKFLIFTTIVYFGLYFLAQQIEKISGRLKKPKDKIFFLRTVKTGSSTILNIFYRLALRYRVRNSPASSVIFRIFLAKHRNFGQKLKFWTNSLAKIQIVGQKW